MSAEQYGDQQPGQNLADVRPRIYELPAGASAVEAYNIVVGNQTTSLAPLIVEAIRHHEPRLLSFLSLADAELSAARCYSLDDQSQKQIVPQGLHKPQVERVEPYSQYWRRRPTAQTYFALGRSRALGVSTRRELQRKELSVDLESLRDESPEQRGAATILSDKPLDMVRDFGTIASLLPPGELEQFVNAYNRYSRESISYWREACDFVETNRAEPLQLMTVLNALNPYLVRFSMAKRPDRLLTRYLRSTDLLPGFAIMADELERFGLPRSRRVTIIQNARVAIAGFAEARKGKRFWESESGLRDAMLVGEYALKDMIGSVPNDYPNAVVINELRDQRLRYFGTGNKQTSQFFS